MHVSGQILGACALLVCPSMASATSGLQWRLEEPVRYHLEVRVDLPQAWRINAQQNLEAVTSVVEIALATTCRPVEGTRTGWEVECVLDGVALRGVPVDAEPGRLLPILVEWDEVLTGATVTFSLGRDGRVRELQLEGLSLSTSDRRTADIAEKMRLLVVRAFAPLDLQLPKKGDDGGKGAWRQREALVFGFPSSAGAMGSAVVDHEIVEMAGDLIDVRTTGRGVMGSGETVMIGGSEQTANMYALTLEGTARFDRLAGRLISRDYTATGTLTASSIDSTGAAGSQYVQTAALRWLIEDAPIPDLGPTGEIAP